MYRYQCPPCCPYRQDLAQPTTYQKLQEEMVAPSCAGGFFYTVVPGDTMYLIARRYNVSLDALIKANPQITNPSRLFPGMQLCVPTVDQPTPVPIPAPPTCQDGHLYLVRRGDTLSLIAQRYDLAVQDILRANPQITNPNQLFLGQQICIPLPIPEPPTCAGALYTVQKGDTLSSIATRYGLKVEDITTANPQITNPNLIFVGQQICLPGRD